MEGDVFIQRVKGLDFFRGQVQHVEALPVRPAKLAAVPGGLHPAVREALEAEGIGQLYSHQAEAIGKVRQGRHVVVVTGTASGKTLCYNIPIVEAAIADPSATAMFLYPTKALARTSFGGSGGSAIPRRARTSSPGRTTATRRRASAASSAAARASS